MQKKKKTLASVGRCYQVLSGFPANDRLSQILWQSCLSANGKCDNEIITWAVHRSPGIDLTAEKNLGKETVEDGCGTSLLLKWGPLCTITLVGSLSSS